MDHPKPKLLDQLADILRTKRYSARTIEAYSGWVRRYVRFHSLKHPKELDGAHIRSFFSHLAGKTRVSAGTQNQAMAALLFLYREVLASPMGAPQGVTAHSLGEAARAGCLTVSSRTAIMC